MAQWEIALVKEQGISFAVASVKDSVVINRSQADGVIRALSLRLGQPVVLLGAQQHRLYGRTDIVRFLRNAHPLQLPWRRMDIAA